MWTSSSDPEHNRLKREVDHALFALLQKEEVTRIRDQEHQQAVQVENIARGTERYDRAREETYRSRDRLRAAKEDENRKRQAYDLVARQLNNYRPASSK
jgi:hypothetical protein